MKLNKNWIYAIVGASRDKSKYGYIVMKDLKDSGYFVVPINPKGEDVLGETTYPSVGFYDDEIDVAVLVVPPAVTEKVVKECKQIGIKKVWMQPGAESPEAIKFCEENGIECVHNECIMVARRQQN